MTNMDPGQSYKTVGEGQDTTYEGSIWKESLPYLSPYTHLFSPVPVAAMALGGIDSTYCVVYMCYVIFIHSSVGGH